MLSIAPSIRMTATQTDFALSADEALEAPGVGLRVFSEVYDGAFSDAKTAGIEIVHHGVRTVTNGDVRLSPTPAQWDETPQLVSRTADAATRTVSVVLEYPSYHFRYKVSVFPSEGGVRMAVDLESPLPEALAGRAGFNLEFLPSAYFEKSYAFEGTQGSFPLYPASGMTTDAQGQTQPLPFASGKSVVLAPEDPYQRIAVRVVGEGSLALYDGRCKAQNGWFVLRTLLPAGKTGRVVEWQVDANSVPGWVRTPVVAHSQVGYHPAQVKKAVIELDPRDAALPTARLLRLAPDGSTTVALEGPAVAWGNYLCYKYLTFDFSSVKEEGLYELSYGKILTAPFRIARDAYATAWQPTLDVFMPEQMDHMRIREAYRIWHDASHLDDARQAPVNHEHFDLYAQGPTTDTPYAPGEHIPGLDIGGWFDAGDYDIRTQTHYAAVESLVETWELFRPERDVTSVDEKRRTVEMHKPDGVPDLIQQLEHGTLALIAQYRAVGHAIPGIIVPTLEQYTHLGDGAAMTDHMIYDPAMGPDDSDGVHSGKPDDRWAFTSRSTALNYGSAAALAAASRALRGYNDALAAECLSTAQSVWEEEHAKATPDLFHFGNTTGGFLDDEELKAAVELLLCTGEDRYAQRVRDLVPQIAAKGPEFLAMSAVTFARAIPKMDADYLATLRPFVQAYKSGVIDAANKENPFGVPITRRGWAGNGAVVHFAVTNYYFHRYFPDLVTAEDVFRGLNYLYGCHPDSDISFVSAVGTRSKKIAYGHNRADFSFVAGGIVPGVLVLKGGFPENKEDWPFFWGENEYVVGLGPTYIFAVQAVQQLLAE